jgi:glycosyl transferase/beta-hydroxylase protein BlmF
MAASAATKGTGRFEILAYIDEDDPTQDDYSREGDIEILTGPSDGVGRAWNRLARKSQGNLLMMANDDLVFVTEEWDRKIVERLRIEGPVDHIFVAWTNDGSSSIERRCAFPMVSRRWFDTLGYFTPECFNFLWHDTWIHDIGRRLDRLIYMPDILIEHRHFSFKKAEYDDTYKRHRVGAENANKRKQDERTYDETANIREIDARILREYIEAAHEERE